ncbi:MAG: hypothetical protein JXX14_16435 [Deltaproteobacteria bacterium]|nr:hypothetical protein [Deltaproteobacteria bacterium]
MRSGIVIQIVLALSFAWAVGAGCDQREQQECRMANEYVVAKTTGTPRSLEVIRLDASRIAVFWSADRNVYYAVINNKGVPMSRPVQIVQPSVHPIAPKTWWHSKHQLVLDAVSLSPVRVSDNLVALAMLCHQNKGAAQVATALVDMKNSTVRWVTQTGQTGLFAKTVSATFLDDTLLVGWQDSFTPKQSIALSAVDIETGETLTRTHIDAQTAAYGPKLARNGNRALVLWTEVDGHQKTVRLYSAPIGRDLKRSQRHLVDTLELFDAAADLTPYGSGFAALYRDDRDEDHTEEFYFTVLDPTGRRTQPAARISRADGPQGPRLSSGNSLLFSSAVRSYNNNYLVGFNRFDSAGTKTGGEFQVYADKCDFIRAGLASNGDNAILVYGENADAGGRILAATISCSAK